MKLPGLVTVHDSRDDVLDHLGEALTAAALHAVHDRGVFHLALSGGSTPEPFYRRLMIDPHYRHLPWAQTHLWIVDERCVPEDHEKSNYRMIRETIVEHAPIKKRHCHPMPVLHADPAAEYEATLREAFAQPADPTPPALDFVLLGMGDDGHTASLFPHSPALDERTRWVAANDGPHVVPPPRLTMTYPLLNAARALAVLCLGEKKQQALHRVAQAAASRGYDPQLPITGIQPTRGELVWHLDTAAAG